MTYKIVLVFWFVEHVRRLLSAASDWLVKAARQRNGACSMVWRWQLAIHLVGKKAKISKLVV